MAYYGPQNPQAGDDFMSFNSGTTGPSYMGGDGSNQSFMNPHDSQQSYNTNFMDMGDQGSRNSGYQDPNQGYNPPDSSYASSGVDTSLLGGAPGYDQQPYGGDPSIVEGHPSTYDQQSIRSRGDSSFEAGHLSTQDPHSIHSRGDNSFEAGHLSTQDQQSNLSRGDSSFEAGRQSSQDPQLTHSRGDSSFEAGHSSTSGLRSPVGIPAQERNAFDSSIDGHRAQGSNMQVEVLTERISQETNGQVDGFAATLRVLAELARGEQTFTRGQRFAWRFLTLAEAGEAGGDLSSAKLRDAGEPTQDRVLVEVHRLLGGRGANIANLLESLERDARLDASDDWGVDSPVNALSESQGIAFDQVELHRRGPIPTLADGLRRLGMPVRRASAQAPTKQPHASTSQGPPASISQGPHASSSQGPNASTSTQGGSTPSRPAPTGRGGRGPSPSPRGGGAPRGRGGPGGPVFQSTGKQGL